MVVDETMKSIEAANAAGVDESEAARSCDRHAARAEDEIRDVVRDQAFVAAEHLLLLP
ncbi:hypothetical protein D3C83_240490 [compost metagenome]